jgi:hypothetical protein
MASLQSYLRARLPLFGRYPALSTFLIPTSLTQRLYATPFCAASHRNNADMYNRFKDQMWQNVATEMGIPWRSAESMHWQLGEQEMSARANAPVFELHPSATGTGMSSPSQVSGIPAYASHPDHSALLLTLRRNCALHQHRSISLYPTIHLPSLDEVSSDRPIAVGLELIINMFKSSTRPLLTSGTACTTCMRALGGSFSVTGATRTLEVEKESVLL